MRLRVLCPLLTYVAIALSPVANSQTTCTVRRINFGNYNVTTPSGINKYDTVVGQYLTSTSTGLVWKGFRWYNGKSIYTSFQNNYVGTNDLGWTVGTDANGGFLAYQGKGYLLTYPGGGTTSPVAINNHLAFLSGYTDSNGKSGWFYTDSIGFHLLPSYPGAYSTTFSGLNDSGMMVGSYQAHDYYSPRGFVYYNGNFTALDYPGAQGTIPMGINNSGTIVGYYYKSLTGWAHAFTLKGTTFTSYNMGGAFETRFNAISNTGHTTGIVIFSDSANPEGFIRACQ